MKLLQVGWTQRRLCAFLRGKAFPHSAHQYRLCARDRGIRGGCYAGQEQGDACCKIPPALGHLLSVPCSRPSWSDRQRGCCCAGGMESKQTELQQIREQKKMLQQPYRSLLPINLPHAILSSAQISESPGAVWVGLRGWGNPFSAPWGAEAQRGVFCLPSAAAGLG